MMVQLQILGEIVLAMLLGGAIGFEREAADKPAGLRTHMLVAGSAAMLTGLGSVMVTRLGVDQSVISADPIRIIEAVITGITFLGAGTIIRNRDSENKIEGLTTAASLLLAAALGVAIALQQFVLAVGAAAVIVLAILQPGLGRAITKAARL
jgi:putative Mg2+ transporter-C (MgtC) family protein